MQDQDTTRQSHRTHSHLTQSHLTDEQFSDLLLGTNPASVQAHLGACAQCAAEADRVAGAIGSFEQQTRLWAEGRAAALPTLVAGRRNPSSLLWVFRPQAWTAVAVAIALAASLSLTAHNRHTQAVGMQAQVQPAAALTPAALKADNDLLSAIDGELRADDSTPASVYSLSSARHGDRTHGAKRMISE